MIWLKFVLGGLIIAFCTLLGWVASGKYRARKSFFMQLSALNDKYLAELKFARKPISQFLSENHFVGDFEKYIQEFSKHRSVDTNYNYLSREERDYISEYFSMLGKGDSHSQNSYFSAQVETLLDKKSAYEKEAKSRSELYLKLGLISGLAFVILIV